MMLALLLSPAAAAPSSLVATVKANLQEIADASASKYDCAFAIAVRGPNGVAASVSSGTGAAGVDAKFAWGSVTKMVTGVSAIRLANAGVFSLDDRVAPLLDPYFAKHGESDLTLAGMFGPLAKDITIRNLATMTAGVPDFDTATPNEKNVSASTDPFRATVYATPAQDWSPFDLLRLKWVGGKGALDFPPGTKKAYSSTNFLLLGLVLAAATNGGGVAWDRFDQFAFRPAAAASAGLLNRTAFARHGAPSAYTTLDAYDRTSYNGHNASARPGTKVDAVHGVFGGWTASDIVAPVQDIADLVFDIYGPRSPSSLVAPSDIAMMTNASQGFYGFATFLLSDFTGMPTDGPPPDLSSCWGHLGATYGWNSLGFLNPGTNISVAIATNIETDEQAGPSDAYCVAYNRVRQLVARGAADGAAGALAPIEDCVYVASGYFGTCVCPGVMYNCERSTYGGRCVPSHYGNESHAECAASCR